MQRSEAADAGLPTRPISDIRGGDATYNARALRALLMGEPGPYRDAVLYNAAEALVVAGAADNLVDGVEDAAERSEEHTSELQSLMRNSYAVSCLKKKKTHTTS